MSMSDYCKRVWKSGQCRLVWLLLTQTLCKENLLITHESKQLILTHMTTPTLNYLSHLFLCIIILDWISKKQQKIVHFHHTVPHDSFYQSFTGQVGSNSHWL